MIRRTVDSKSWNGDTILPLKPYIHINALIRLRDWESAILEEKCHNASEG
jgi:hypothetical protein